MVRIITDSVASIPADVAREAGIDIVTLYVNRDGTEYADASMDLDAFYADIYDMVDDIPTSSQPSQHTLEELFEASAKAGEEVLGIFISTGLSGTFDGAVRAARAVKSRNIDFACTLIDSTSCGYDEAWPVFDAVEARDAGAGLAGCTKAALAGMESTRFLFTPETLTFLQKGGRIGGGLRRGGSGLRGGGLVPRLHLGKDQHVSFLCNDVDLTPARAKIHLQHPASSAPVIRGGQPFAHGPPAGTLPLTHNRVFLKRTCGKTAECRIRPAARNAAWSDIPCAFPAGIEDIPSRAAPCTGPARLWPK